MRFISDSRAGLGLVILPFAAAHSWVEAVFRVDPSTRNFIGPPGFPRGGSFRRMTIENSLQDAEYIHRVPDAGVWTGEELMNKDPMGTKGPENEILEVAPGDYIAVQHLENGHVSLIDEGRPLNAGTIFIYGTAEPTDQDKISDIHLKWNEDGTGGDGRGRLLATRNYDDKQCYEGNPAKDVPLQRSGELGTDPATSLYCQSDIKLPDDLKPNSQYTIYWYWDWPMLNTAVVDMEATKEGKFPWSGSVSQDMAPEAKPIVSGEGYTSTVDLKVVDKGAVSAKALGPLPQSLEFMNNSPDIYSQAIGDQLKDNFDVEPQSYEDGGNAEEPLPESQVPDQPAATKEPQADKETVTVTKTVTEPGSPTSCSPTSTQTVTELETQFTTVYADAPTTLVTSTRESGAPPTETATLDARDKPYDWKAAARGFIVRPRNV